MKIAYFINQYPKVSHTFIRREILALERLGFEVQRTALLGWSETVPDPIDRAEQSKTRYVLRQGAGGLLLPMLRMLTTAPARLLGAFALALRISVRSDRRLLRHLVRVIEACRLTLWLRRSGVERLHAHFGTNSAEIALYARRLGGPPYSFTVHGPEEFESPMALAEKVRDAAFVVAISSYGRSQLYLRCPVRDWPKIQVVHCGIEHSFHAAVEAVTPLAHRLVCVGRLCEAKGQLLLIDATARLRAEGIPCDLVLAGDGNLRTEIEAAIQRHGLQDAVRITGWIASEQVRREIFGARALVLPTFAEGLPVVIMEAMALRRPVISTYVAGIPELVRDGETGWLFPAGSLEQLVQAMRDCLTSPSERIASMGDAGHARVIERHSIDIEADELSRLFRMQLAHGPV